MELKIEEIKKEAEKWREDKLSEPIKDEADKIIKDQIKEMQDLKSWREINKQTQGFIWNDEEVIQNKVFPMDLHKDSFYFGCLLPKNISEVNSKGVNLGKKQAEIPCLITSDKKNRFIEVTYKTREELNIDFDNIPSFLPKRWKLKFIKCFLDGESKKVEGKELLSRIISQYEKYLYRRNKTWYKISAIWDIGTYLYMIFEAYPLYEYRGIAGTAKTKGMVVSSFISFNATQIMVNPSESTLFRETDEVRGTKYFDEAEKLWVFNKATKQFEGDIRTELINASYTKDAKVPRQEKIGNRFVTKWYSPYSPTKLSSINGLYGATETRAITEITTKSPDNDSRGEIDPNEDKNELIWEELRDECYRFALDNWKEIREIYNNFPKDCGLKRRDFQIWKPILSIAKRIGEDDYKEVLDFAIEISKRKLDDLIDDSSFDYMVLSALKKAIQSHKETTKIYVNWIKFAYCEERGDQQGLTDTYLNRNISNHLDKLGFKEFRNRDKEASYFAVTPDIFNEIVSPICPQLAFLSTPSTSSTPLSIKEEKIDVDDMVMNVDSKNEKMAMVAINGDNVDTYQDGDTHIFSESKIKQLQQECIKNG